MFNLSVIVPILYLSLPVAAIVFAGLRFRMTRNANPLREMLVTFVMGSVGGLAVAAFYMQQATTVPHDSHNGTTSVSPEEKQRGTVRPTEVAVACYWGIAVACALRVLNAALKWGIGRVTAAGKNGAPCTRSADIAGAVARAIMLLGFGVPYVGSMVLLWRPHVVNDGTPRSLLQRDYQDISFMTSDGLRLRGWWIPAVVARDQEATSDGPAISKRTIILCHGFNADKALDLAIVRDLVTADFNVLAFDFRGHGQSDGQFCTFGDLERRDVLGAVRWVRKNHPEESRKLFGIGNGLGSAALIAAAADPTNGQAIEAVAVFSPFDRADHLVQQFAKDNYIPSMGWMARHISMQMAGLQLGTSLSRFAPEDYIDQIAPRPVLVIGTEQDDMIDINLTRQVYEQASQPKYSYWLKKNTPATMLRRNTNTSRALRVFFETAREVL